MLGTDWGLMGSNEGHKKTIGIIFPNTVPTVVFYRKGSNRTAFFFCKRMLKICGYPNLERYHRHPKTGLRSHFKYSVPPAAMSSYVVGEPAVVQWRSRRTCFPNRLHLVFDPFRCTRATTGIGQRLRTKHEIAVFASGGSFKC